MSEASRLPPPRVPPAPGRRRGLRVVRALFGLIGDPPRLPGAEDKLALRLHGACQAEQRMGLRVLAGGALIVGVWGGLVPLSGAVILPGVLVSESHVKKVQHPTGGVVARIDVRDGDHVEGGATVIHLDDTSARAGLQVVSGQLAAMRARVSRLVAERDGADTMAPPQIEGDDKEATAIIAAEQNLFRARRAAREGQKDLLLGRIGQLEEELRGLDAQTQSLAAQKRLIVTETQGVETLYAKQLVPLARLTALQREAARLDGTEGQLASNAAETRAKIDETKLQATRLDQDFRAEVMKDLRESQDKEAELSERAVAARDLFARLDIRAPTAGVVHQLAVHTVGGVASPGEVLMEIVPEQDELKIEGRLSTRDIDQAHVGQPAQARFPAFNQRTTPEISGRVDYISADSAHDPQGGQPYYQVRVSLAREEVERLGGLKLVPGMPAELLLSTGQRTMLSYLFKPIGDQLARVFRER
jgi:HlyD family secretion protein